MNPVLKILSQHQSGSTFFFSYKLIEHQNISVNWRKFLFPNMISMEKRDLFKFVILNSPLRGMWFKEFLIILRTCQASHFLPMIFFTIHCNCWANDRGELEDGEEVPFFGWYLLNGFYKIKIFLICYIYIQNRHEKTLPISYQSWQREKVFNNISCLITSCETERKTVGRCLNTIFLDHQEILCVPSYFSIIWWKCKTCYSP